MFFLTCMFKQFIHSFSNSTEWSSWANPWAGRWVCSPAVGTALHLVMHHVRGAQRMGALSRSPPDMGVGLRAGLPGCELELRPEG